MWKWCRRDSSQYYVIPSAVDLLYGLLDNELLQQIHKSKWFIQYYRTDVGLQ